MCDNGALWHSRCFGLPQSRPRIIPNIPVGYGIHPKSLQNGASPLVANLEQHALTHQVRQIQAKRLCADMRAQLTILPVRDRPPAARIYGFDCRYSSCVPTTVRRAQGPVLYRITEKHWLFASNFGEMGR